MRRFKQSEPKAARDVLLEVLKRWPNVNFGAVNDVLNRMPEDEQITALHRLERLKSDQDPLSVFKSLNVKAPVREVVSQVKPGLPIRFHHASGAGLLLLTKKRKCFSQTGLPVPLPQLPDPPRNTRC